MVFWWWVSQLTPISHNSNASHQKNEGNLHTHRNCYKYLRYGREDWSLTCDTTTLYKLIVNFTLCLKVTSSCLSQLYLDL